MSTPVPTRFSESELQTIDQLVAQGVGVTRSDVIRRAVGHLDEAVRRGRCATMIVESYLAMPQTAEDDATAMANAIALTEAEPW